MRGFFVFVSLLIAIPADAAVMIHWVTVGDPGNACDLQSQGCFGAVSYAYRISKYEVTNTQYAEFRNAVAKTDTNALYSIGMGSGYGGITRSGSSGSFTYTPIAGREEMPVNFVSFWDALRFANWLHNGQPTGEQDSTTTEDGAYTLTPAGIAANSILRNPCAAIFLTSDDEWYKAAYYAGSGTYYDHPAGSDTQIACAVPGATVNTANCDVVEDDLTDAGSYTGSASPYGTFDQGGNVWEWTDAIVGSNRRRRGGCLNNPPDILAASYLSSTSPSNQYFSTGFRVASPVPPVPTPRSDRSAPGGSRPARGRCLSPRSRLTRHVPHRLRPARSGGSISRSGAPTLHPPMMLIGRNQFAACFTYRHQTPSFMTTVRNNFGREVATEISQHLSEVHLPERATARQKQLSPPDVDALDRVPLE